MTAQSMLRHSAGPVLVRLLCLALIAAIAPAAQAATSCFSDSCGGVCTPGLPVEISTLIPSSDFPPEGSTPIALVSPNDHRGKFLIATQQGVILVWDGATQSILPTFFLDLRDDVGGPVLAGGERGLLSMVADPDYASNGYFYVFYTAASGGPGSTGDIVIERYQRSAANADVADPASATTLLVISHPAGNHNGGHLAFGPNDGFLYISTGDGGGGCDSGAGANGDGQITTTLAGKILRIDVNGIDGGGGAPDDCSVSASSYTVPSSNPFFGTEPACDEIWSYGLRNPFRFSFDQQNGDMYIGDVGQLKWEEINLQLASTPAPVNFGWVCREGCETANNDESFCSTTGCPVDTGTTCEFPRASGFWDPILCHYNGGWDSIMGGYVYRGNNVPSLIGDYIYGDAACGQLWKTTNHDPTDPASISSACWASGFGGTFGFAEDHLRELYVVVGGAGRIDCIHNGDGCSWAGAEVFANGFESGDTDGWTSATP